MPLSWEILPPLSSLVIHSSSSPFIPMSLPFPLLPSSTYKLSLRICPWPSSTFSVLYVLVNSFSLHGFLSSFSGTFLHPLLYPWQLSWLQFGFTTSLLDVSIHTAYQCVNLNRFKSKFILFPLKHLFLQNPVHQGLSNHISSSSS